MTIVGVLFENKLHYVVYTHYTIGLILILLKILGFLKSPSIDIKIQINDNERLLLLPVIFISMIYLFISLYYYERGWDALHFYFPNALYFFIVDGIPSGINPLSFFPLFKPPLNSLYITYSLMVGNGTQNSTTAELHPWIFLMGTMLLVYELTFSVLRNRSHSILAALIYLSTPITYFLIYEYAYYQELPVMFFMTASFYQMSHSGKYNAYIASISAALSILSKLSGYTIILLILLSFSKNKNTKIFIISIITLFLAHNAAYDKYVGYSVIIILIGIYLIYLSYRRIQATDRTIVFVTVPTMIGSFWLWFMVSIPKISDQLLKRYISTENTQIITVYNAINNPYIIYIENGMRVSFTASVLYIFTGFGFGLFYSIPKLYAIICSEHPLMNNMKIYTLTFMMFWFAYYGDVSMRYLMPILPMLTVFITVGFIDILKKLKVDEDKIFTKFIFAITGSFFMYPFLPVDYLLLNANERLYAYHNDQLKLIIYLIIFSYLFRKAILKQWFIPRRQYRIITRITMILFLLLSTAPQLYFFITNPFDQQGFNTDANYAMRENFQQLYEVINELQINTSSIILSVNTPGLEYYTTRTVADLMFLSIADDTYYVDLNYTQAIELIHDNQIDLVVKLNTKHVYYSTYITSFANLAIMDVVGNPQYPDLFTLVMSNPEFILYARIDAN